MDDMPASLSLNPDASPSALTRGQPGAVSFVG